MKSNGKLKQYLHMLTYNEAFVIKKHVLGGKRQKSQCEVAAILYISRSGVSKTKSRALEKLKEFMEEEFDDTQKTKGVSNKGEERNRIVIPEIINVLKSNGKLNQYLRKLTYNEAFVIKKYVLGGKKPKTQSEVAEILSISRSGVSKTKSRALKKLKEFMEEEFDNTRKTKAVPNKSKIKNSIVIPEIVNILMENGKLGQYLRKLTYNEASVVKRFGFSGNRRKTQSEIAAILNLRRESVLRIEKRALEKLKDIMDGKFDDIQKRGKRRAIPEILNVLMENGKLDQYVAMLSDNEATVIKGFGLNGEVRKTQSEIAAILNISQRSVLRIELRALKKLEDIMDGKFDDTKKTIKVADKGKRKKRIAIPEIIKVLMENEKLDQYLSMLMDDEAAVIKRFGLSGKKTKTQSEIAVILNISVPSVSRTEKRALKKLEDIMDGKFDDTQKIKNVSGKGKRKKRKVLLETIKALIENGKLDQYIYLLTDNEAAVIKRFGLSGEVPKTQSEIAVILDISHRSVLRIEHRALKKLKDIMEGKFDDTKKTVKPADKGKRRKRKTIPEIIKVLMENGRLDQYLSMLSDNEAAVIKEFRVSGETPKTQSKIAAILNISQSSVSKAKKGALKKFKDIMEGKFDDTQETKRVLDNGEKARD